MNTDLTLLRTATRSDTGQPCRVTRIIEALEEPYRSAAMRLVNTPHNQGGLADMPLAAEFRQAGIQISSTMINRHRNGWCPCTPRKEKAA